MNVNDEFIMTRDDDGHWFMIPAYSYEHFHTLVEREEYDLLLLDFSKYMIDRPESIIITRWEYR